MDGAASQDGSSPLAERWASNHGSGEWSIECVRVREGERERGRERERGEREREGEREKESVSVSE